MFLTSHLNIYDQTGVCSFPPDSSTIRPEFLLLNLNTYHQTGTSYLSSHFVRSGWFLTGTSYFSTQYLRSDFSFPTATFTIRLACPISHSNIYHETDIFYFPPQYSKEKISPQSNRQCCFCMYRSLHAPPTHPPTHSAFALNHVV